jgi:hypothetical protein
MTGYNTYCLRSQTVTDEDIDNVNVRSTCEPVFEPGRGQGKGKGRARGRGGERGYQNGEWIAFACSEKKRSRLRFKIHGFPSPSKLRLYVGRTERQLPQRAGS